MSAKRLFRVGDVKLCVETFGEPTNPSLLLIGGAAASMDWWDDGFCRELAEAGRFVIRYDHRDTGESTCYPPGEPGYTSAALASDAIGVLDALGIERAHLVGISMGGGLAQALAAAHPQRLASLTLISTTAADHVERDLPPIGAGLGADPPEPDWSDTDAVIDYLVAGERAYEGPEMFDEHAVRALASRIIGRTRDLEASFTNHWVVVGGDDDGEVPAVDLDAIEVPTLVIHGTADPLFALAHGEALADAIEGAELLVLEGVGHQAPPPSTWDEVVPAIVRVSNS